MAPISSHQFQKLKLNTSAPSKPVASTFDSIPRHEAQPNGTGPAVHHDTPGSSVDEPGRRPYDHAEDQWQAHCGVNGHAYGGTAIHGSGSDSDFESNFRKRTKSISFDREVTLDNGNRLSAEEPLPKHASTPSSLQEASDAEYSDHSYVEVPFDRRKHLHHRVGESRYPLLQTTVDELAKEPQYHEETDHVASLTSETTASPEIEEVRTPLETPTEYLLSPRSATSPVEFPAFYPRRNGPTRARSYRTEIAGTEGRASRRSSARSARSMSSMSPAASFLARYKAADGPLKPTEPDDEGQAIGYHGEFIIGKQLGFGGFSVVKEVTSIEAGKSVVHAVKIVRRTLKDKTELENEQIQTQFDHEVEIWRFLRHPYILPLLQVCHTEFATFCITRLNKGGTLFDLVRDTHKKKKKGIDMALAKRYAYQLASALRYLHNDVMVVHRDVKLENCLIDMTVPNAEREGGDVLLCDFGMADFIVSDQRDGPEPHSIGENQNIGPAETSTSIAGSLQYAAPELFHAGGPVFSPAADIWAYGVVMFAVLTARLPFNEGLDAKTTIRIQKGDWDMELLRGSDAAQQASIDDAVELLQGCLHMDPLRRWTINDVLSCKWLSGCDSKYENVPRSWLADS